LAQRTRLRANVSASEGKEHDSSVGGDGSGSVVTATMAERVQKRVLDVFLNVFLNVSSSATKKIAAKVHAQLTRKNPVFMSVVD